MEYARHQAEGSKRADDGSLVREHWEHAAARGSTAARAKLQAPEFPEALEYLWGWTLELYGRSGVSMAGLNPLTYQTLDAWARLTGRDPMPHEVEALILLDAALRSEPDDTEADEPPEPPAWPEPKRA